MIGKVSFSSCARCRHKINKLTYNNLCISVTFLDFVFVSLFVFFSVLPLFLYKSPSFLPSVPSSPLSLLSLSAVACLPVSPPWVLLPPPCLWGPSPSSSSWVRGGHVAKVLSSWQIHFWSRTPTWVFICHHDVNILCHFCIFVSIYLCSARRIPCMFCRLTESHETKSGWWTN